MLDTDLHTGVYFLNSAVVGVSAAEHLFFPRCLNQEKHEPVVEMKKMNFHRSIKMEFAKLMKFEETDHD